MASEPDFAGCLEILIIEILGAYDTAIRDYNSAEPESNEFYFYFGQVEKLSYLVAAIPHFFEGFDIPEEDRKVTRNTSDDGLAKLKGWPKRRF